jgi:predicted nucleic acid-binding Zn ribbon protein
MADKKSNHEFEHISDIIKVALKNWLQTAGEPITRVWELWDEAAGDHIARNTRPASLKHQILTVHVSSPAWIQELRFSKKSIMEKINAAAGIHLVSDIKFTIDN